MQSKKINLLAFLLIFVFTLGACAPAQPTISEAPVSNSTETLDEIDSSLFEQLSKIYQLFAESINQIWTSDYRLDLDPLLLIRVDENGDAQYGYIVNHPEPESFEGAQLVDLPDDLNLPPVYRLNEIPNAKRLENVPFFDFAYPANGTDVYMMKYTDPDDDPFMSPTNFDWILFFAHEGFHRYQMNAWEIPDSMQDVKNYPLNADNIALIYLENHLLLDALSASDSELDDILQQFIAVRSLRIEQWEEVALLDNPQEAAEGTARYIETQISEVASIRSEGQPSMEDYLIISLNTKEHIRDELAFGRFYSTGAALSTLMDRLGRDWKAQIEAGKTQYDVLSEYYKLTDAVTLVEEAKEAYDFPALYENAEETAKIAASEPTDIFGYKEGAPPMGGEVMVESIQKPYLEAPENLVPSYIPDGYDLLGSFVYAISELDFAELGTLYSPTGSDITVVDFSNEDQPEPIRISYADFPNGTLEEWEANNIIGMFGQEIQLINDTEVSTIGVTGGEFSMATFIHNDQLITIEGSISLEENLKIVISILEK